MTESKLTELLSSLDNKELSHFSEFVQADFFNKHAQVKLLCDYLLKVAPDFGNARKMAKERVFEYLYPQQPYNDNLLASIQSKLLKLLQKFLALNLFLEDETAEMILTIKALRLKKLEKHYTLAEKQCLKLLESSPNTLDKSAWHFSGFYREQDLWFLAKGGRTYHEALQKNSDSLDLFYCVEKLRLACDMTSRNIVTDALYDCKMIESVQDFLRLHPQHLENYPILELYLIVLELLKNPNEESHYKKLIAVLNTKSLSLQQEELKRIYDYALNYCVKQINEGNIQYYEETLSLYRLLLKRELIFIDGELPAWEYKNIVTAAVRTAQFDWAREFIESYKNQLPSDLQDNAYCYNLASLYYALGQHKEALQSLHNVEFTDTTYHLGAKIIQVKSFFELGEWEALHAALDAFSAYIRRHKEIGEYRKQANLNFINCCRQLCRLFEQQDWIHKNKFEQKMLKIGKMVNELSPIASKDWIEAILKVL